MTAVFIRYSCDSNFYTVLSFVHLLALCFFDAWFYVRVLNPLVTCYAEADAVTGCFVLVKYLEHCR